MFFKVHMTMQESAQTLMTAFLEVGTHTSLLTYVIDQYMFLKLVPPPECFFLSISSRSGPLTNYKWNERWEILWSKWPFQFRENKSNEERREKGNLKKFNSIQSSWKWVKSFQRVGIIKIKFTPVFNTIFFEIVFGCKCTKLS